MLLALVAVFVLVRRPKEDAEGPIAVEAVLQQDGTFSVTLTYQLDGLDPSMAYIGGYMMGPAGAQMVVCCDPQVIMGVASQAVRSQIIVTRPGRYALTFYFYSMMEPVPKLSETQWITLGGQDGLSTAQPDDTLFVMVTATPTPFVTPEPTAAPTPTPSPTATPGVTAAVRTAAPTSTPTPTPRPKLRPDSDLFDLYPKDTRYFYHQMTQTQKQAYAELYDGVAHARTSIEITPCSMEDFDLAMYAVYNDSPELFLLDTISSYTYYKQYPDNVYRVSLNYRCDESTFRDQLSQVLDQIRSLAWYPGFGPSDYSKELVIYQYILQHCYYDKELPNCANADSAWLYGYAKCTGYSRALNLALRWYGIPCVEVVGHTYDNGVISPTGHQWSIVKIDGKWYQCDPTWDDAGDERLDSARTTLDYMPYFNINDHYMYLARTNDPCGFSYPACTSMDANYYAQNGLYVRAGSSVRSAVGAAFRNALASGVRETAVLFESASDFNTLMMDTDNIRSYDESIRNANWTWWFIPEMQLMYVAELR